MSLRDYQLKAIKDTFSFLNYYKDKSPVIVLPTGSGKSHVIAHICKIIVQNHADRRILMLTHQKELIEQNRDKILAIWPNAPLGIYSASVGQKVVDAITFGGIQTVRNNVSSFGKIDMVIIDEAHFINHIDQGTYRKVLNMLLEVNPRMRIVGLTATPYRVGHGLITDKPAIFDEAIEPVTIIELQEKGWLAKLISKHPRLELRAKGVGKRGGDYVKSDLAKAMDRLDQNRLAVIETIERAEDRKSWLFFCAGVDHAQHIKEILIEHGIIAECITGDTPKPERERIIQDFKDKKIQALTNNDVLTTGFDAPDIDLIALLRPTCSPGLYVQMVGRGLRLKGHTDHCLILDFAGVIEMHGPITMIQTPKKYNPGEGIAPMKSCPECDEIIMATLRHCHACGYEFPKQEKTFSLRTDDDIMGEDKIKTFSVMSWEWTIQKARKSGKDMIVVTYSSGELRRMKEYLCIWHDGYAGKKGRDTMKDILAQSGPAGVMEMESEEAVQYITRKGVPPAKISYMMDGKFERIIKREWSDEIPF